MCQGTSHQAQVNCVQVRSACKSVARSNTPYTGPGAPVERRGNTRSRWRHHHPPGKTLHQARVASWQDPLAPLYHSLSLSITLGRSRPLICPDNSLHLARQLDNPSPHLLPTRTGHVVWGAALTDLVVAPHFDERKDCLAVLLHIIHRTFMPQLS
jgi:hypothetical protein